MKITIGQLKYLFDRQRNYMTWINTAMIAYLFFEKVQFKWYYLLVVLCMVLVMTFIDAKYILPSEGTYIWNKNPRVKDLFKAIEDKNEK